MTKKILIAVLVIIIGGVLFSNGLFSKSIPDEKMVLSTSWINTNVEKIISEAPNKTEFKFLKHTIGSCKIVALGEPTHRDGATFEIRSRIIDYLINEMDFSVIIFENGIFDLRYANELLHKKNDAEGVRFLLGRVGLAKQNDQMFSTLQKNLDNNQPIDIAGFDCQLSSSFSSKKGNYSLQLFELLENISPSISEKTEYLEYKNIWQEIDLDMKKGGIKSASFKMNDKEKQRFRELSSFVQNILTGNNLNDWTQIVKSTDESIITYSDLSLLKIIFNRSSLTDLNNRRDQLMADNLVYLLENKFKDRKVILIGATYHFARNISTLMPKKVKGFPIRESKTLGDFIYPKYKDDIYMIGFIAYDGTYGFIKEGKEGKDMPEAPSSSLEYQLANYGYENAFIPLNDINYKEGFWGNSPVIRIIDYKANTYCQNWSKVIDGIIFTRTQYPATY